MGTGGLPTALTVKVSLFHNTYYTSNSLIHCNFQHVLHIETLFYFIRSNYMYQPPQNPDEPGYPPPQQPSYPQQPPPQGYPPQQPYYPPQYIPPPQKKSRTWLWIVLGVLAVLILGCIGVSTLVLRSAGTAINSVSTTVASTVTTIAETPTTQAQPAAQVFGILSDMDRR